MIRLGAIVALAALLVLCVASPASAHKASWPIHKIWSKAKDRLVDPPPRPPDADCNNANDVGKTLTIWDPILREYIDWICVDLEGGGYGWRRVPWQHTPFDQAEFPRIVTWDWHRACRSIVCKKEITFHTRHFTVRDLG